jgi:Methyltransferase domain
MMRKILSAIPTNLSPENQWRARVFAATIDSLRRRARPEVRDCNCCGYRGFFGPYGWPMRPEAQCPKCGSLERHRLFKFWFDSHENQITDRRLLHFAPEATISALLRPLAAEYVTADISPGADLRIDIEDMALPNDRFDVIVCSHVLEHVNDRAALAEMKRVLAPNGLALLMIPIIEGWPTTYEDPSVSDRRGRAVHYGQEDHVRYFGADFRDRVRRAGFALAEVTATGPLSVKYGLYRGEKLFLVTNNRCAAV